MTQIQRVAMQQHGAVHRIKAMPRFTSTLGVDLGGTLSLKVRVFDKEGNEVASFGRRDLAPEGIRSTEHYERTIGTTLSTGLRALDPNIQQQLKQDPLEGIAVFGPGQFREGFFPLFPNIVDLQGNPLRNIHVGKIAGHLYPWIKDGLKPEDKTQGANDMNGVATGLVATLSAHPQPAYQKLLQKDRSEVFVIMTGKGCGTLSLRHVQGEIELISKEPQHAPYFDGKTLEAGGASSDGLLMNYAKVMEIDPKKLTETNDARLVTEGGITVRRSSPRHLALLGTGKYTEQIPDDETVRLTLKRNWQKRHQKAAMTAINAYLDRIAYLIHFKMAEGVNAVVLTGPLAEGLKGYVNAPENAVQVREFFQGDLRDGALVTLFDVILATKVLKMANHASRTMAEQTGMLRGDKLQILTDVFLPDNAVGTHLFLQHRQTDQPHIRTIPSPYNRTLAVV